MNQGNKLAGNRDWYTTFICKYVYYIYI